MSERFSELGAVKEQDFIHLFSLGLKPIPLIWDQETKTASNHCIKHGDVTKENYTDLTFNNFVKSFDNVNGMALKLFPPFGCFDFDLKNTEDKTVFNRWLERVNFINDGILSKICIEKTRNGGYHVYIKYSKLTSKISLAREVKGEEVIAIYTGGTLSYCDPTPGYDMYHNTFEDLEELTDDEFELLTSLAIDFDKYVIKDNDYQTPIITHYPKEQENLCLQFDKSITDEAFELLLNDIDLYRVNDYKYTKKDHFIAFLRKGSKSKFSAKVYFNSKKLLIFSGSIVGFPHWGTRKDKDDQSWVLSPSKIIYYKNDKDWASTTEEIRLISVSIGLEIIEDKQPEPILDTNRKKLEFPLEIFPKEIQEYIRSHPFQPEYMAAGYISAFAALIGNSTVLIANNDYFVKAVIYLALVAPPGSAKSPSAKIVFKHLDDIDNSKHNQYELELKDYNEQLQLFKSKKKGSEMEEPVKPVLSQIQINDCTIEMLIKILKNNPLGSCLVTDELSGFLKRMNGRYGETDEVQKWLEIWSSSPINIQRIGRDSDRVSSPTCGIYGGIQPGVLDSLSRKENEHNGFYHRVLFVYPEMKPKANWSKYIVSNELKNSVKSYFTRIYASRNIVPRYVRLSYEADSTYGDWFNSKNLKYNAATSDNIKGIIAKYQDYCLRLSLVLHMLDDDYEQDNISKATMDNAIKLTEYFLENMRKALKILAPESPVDKLNGKTLEFYNALPQSFTTKTAIEVAKKLEISENNCRVMLTRLSKKDKDDTLLTFTGSQTSKVYDKEY